MYWISNIFDFDSSDSKEDYTGFATNYGCGENTSEPEGQQEYEILINGEILNKDGIGAD